MCIGMASPTAPIDEPVNPTHPALILLILIGFGCGLTLIVILVLVSYVLRLRIKRRQSLVSAVFCFTNWCYGLLKIVIPSEHLQQKYEMKLSNPWPDSTYDNAQEMLILEKTQAN